MATPAGTGKMANSNSLDLGYHSLPQAPTPMPTPNPILRKGLSHSRKRMSPSPKFSVGFSQDVMSTAALAKKRKTQRIPSTAEEEDGDEDDLVMEESDTDVGSSNEEDDESFSVTEDQEDTEENSAACAKVRRLNLNERCGSGKDNHHQPSMTTVDAEKYLDRSPLSQPDGASPVGNGKAHLGKTLFPSRALESPSTPQASPPSPCGEYHQQRRSPKKNAMLICPPSTAKKSRGEMSRLFADDTVFSGDPEEDVSPRDVVHFPFFGDASTGEKPAEKEQQHDKNDDCKFENDALAASPAPTSNKKSYHRRSMALNNVSSLSVANHNLSPPDRGLKVFGRANSFLQMFSQDMAVEEKENNLKDIHEEGFAISENSQDDDDFIRRGTTERPPCSSYLNPEQNGRPVSATASSSFSRFLSDFEIVGSLGTGTFGSVYKVRNRTDRRLYAIKAAKRAARGVADRNRMLQEVYALASLGDLACEGEMHIVRYHQAWMEEGNTRLYIQTELCELTLLEEVKIEYASMSVSMARGSSAVQKTGILTGEKRRYKLLREMLLALDLVHKSGLIHLDIKPENIFIKNDQYKLGDFGLVSKIEKKHSDVEEGDARYMAMELLTGDLEDLTKSDIFSLGATLYEICLGRGPLSLPSSGPEWQAIRHGTLLPMPHTPPDLQAILRDMMAPDRCHRPSAEELLKKRQLLSEEQRQLIVERNKVTAANMALDAHMQRFKLLSPKPKNGRQFHRSNTIC